MAFGFMERRFNKTIDKLKKFGTLNKENLKEILDDIKAILLDSDVNLKVVRNFIAEIEKKALGVVLEDGKTPSQEIIKLVNNQLTEIFGKKAKELSFKNEPAVMMVVGLQGSGKTTTIGKIAKYLLEKEKKFKKPLLVAGDIYRPAAVDQLKTLAKQVGVEIFEKGTKVKPATIVEQALEFATKNKNDLVIIDTAGRLHIDKPLMAELKEVKKVAKPEEIIYVVDAMSGQDIINVVDEFNKAIKLTGLIISKLDSEARGGAALSIASLLSVPIYLIGTGERLENIDKFYPDRMSSRILGLGDVETLVEKAQTTVSQDANELMYKRMMQGKYDMDDMKLSITEMRKMGDVKGIMRLIPGASKMANNYKLSGLDEKLWTYLVILSSTTVHERRNPLLMKQPKRRERILKGSGRTITEFNAMFAYYEKTAKQMKEMKKHFANGKMPNFKDIMGGGGMGM